MFRWFMIAALAVLLAGCEGDNAIVDTDPTTPPPDGQNVAPMPPDRPQIMPMPMPGAPPMPGQDLPVAPPPPPDGGGEDIQLIQIDQVEILVRDSAPPQITAHVTGVVGDGCSQLKEVNQLRNGNVIDITITASRPFNAICDASAQIFDEMIDIKFEGETPAGEYIIRVNGVEKSFKV